MLRDKFAMAAMHGMLADSAWSEANESIAKEAYKQADMMMKERANWDFSGDPDFMDVQRLINAQNRMPIVPTGKPTGVPGCGYQPNRSCGHYSPDGPVPEFTPPKPRPPRKP